MCGRTAASLFAVFQVLCNIDAEFAAALALTLPPAPLPVLHPASLTTAPSLPSSTHVASSDMRPSLHSAPLVPDALAHIAAEVQHCTSVDQCIETLLPRSYPDALSHTRSLVISGRRVLSRAADAAVLVVSRVLPFLPEAQAHVLSCVL